jgi:hypothetical protein
VPALAPALRGVGEASNKKKKDGPSVPTVDSIARAESRHEFEYGETRSGAPEEEPGPLPKVTLAPAKATAAPRAEAEPRAATAPRVPQPAAAELHRKAAEAEQAPRVATTEARRNDNNKSNNNKVPADPTITIWGELERVSALVAELDSSAACASEASELVDELSRLMVSMQASFTATRDEGARNLALFFAGQGLSALSIALSAPGPRQAARLLELADTVSTRSNRDFAKLSLVEARVVRKVCALAKASTDALMGSLDAAQGSSGAPRSGGMATSTTRTRLTTASRPPLCLRCTQQKPRRGPTQSSRRPSRP